MQRREVRPLGSQLSLSMHPQKRLPKHKDITKVPLPESRPPHSLEWTQNIAWVRINGESSWALLDNGSTISAVTPELDEAWSLDIGPLSELVNGVMGINGFGGLFSWPLGYVIVRVQVEGVRGNNKDQVALVIPDLTAFGSWVLVTLDTLTTIKS